MDVGGTENIDGETHVHLNDKDPLDDQEGWTEVKRKQHIETPDSDQDEASPTPQKTFQGLKNVDEIDKKKGLCTTTSSNSAKRLTRSQKKKLRSKYRGSTPPKHFH